MVPVQVFRKVNGSYETENVHRDDFLQSSPEQLEGLQLVFATYRSVSADSQSKDLLSTNWAYPPMLWTNACLEANGFAGKARHLHSDQKTVNTSWFKFLIKQILGKADGPGNDYRYEWYEMTFHLYVSSSGASVVFCFDTPSTFQENFCRALKDTDGRDTGEPMAHLQCLIISEVSKLYDTSIWTLRDHVRLLEKRRSAPGYVDSVTDLARHVIHTREVLSVAVSTVTKILGEYGSNTNAVCGCTNLTGTATRFNCPHDEILFWLGILQNFGPRATSLNERLSYEISIGFNTAVQRDTRETVKISTAARSDSASMKTIAVVTLAFLPATFVSTIFSMSFFTFNIDDETGQRRWLVSDRFWIYWVVTIPLTILTLVCWAYGQRKAEKGGNSRQESWKSEAPTLSSSEISRFH